MIPYGGPAALQTNTIINGGIDLGPNAALLSPHHAQMLHHAPPQGLLQPQALGKRPYGDSDYGATDDGGDNRQTPKKKGRKKSFIWAHVITDETGKVHCKHCSQLIRVNYGEKVERLRKHFVKSCPKSPFHKDSKEYEELLESVNAPQMESKKKSYIPQGKSKSNRVISYSVGFVATILSGPCMELTPEQIQRLEANGNRSTHWAGVKLTGAITLSYDASLDRIRNCNFSGNIYIGVFVKNAAMEHGITVPSGLYNSNFSGTCILSDNCYIFNTSMLSNVFVGRNSCVVNCAMIVCEGQTSYGTQRNICVGPESDSINAHYARTITLNINSTYYEVCLQALSTKKLLDLTNDPTGNNNNNNNAGNASNTVNTLSDGLGGNNNNNNNPKKFSTNTSNSVAATSSAMARTNRNDDYVRYDMTIICDDVEIASCHRIRNAFIGSYSHVHTSIVDNSTLLSHVHIGGSELMDCVLHNSCSVTSKVVMEGVLMFPHAHVSHGAIVEESVLGPDSSIAAGECKRSLLGPFIGFHHQSLLIASCWPLGRGNIAYGSMIGANHTGRSNDQECLPGEGCFFGLGCSVKFPFSIIHSPYSLIAAGTACIPQKIAFPFSLISNTDGNTGSNTLRPGWVIWSNSYFIERSLSKFQKRRKSVEYRTDFPIFRPSVIDLLLDARVRLIHTKQSLAAAAAAANASSGNNNNNNNPGNSNSNIGGGGGGSGNISGSNGAVLANGSPAWLSDKILAGCGKCVVPREDLDRAIDAYTLFIHRYLLHGLIYLIAMGDTCRLPPSLANMALTAAGVNTTTTINNNNNNPTSATLMSHTLQHHVNTTTSTGPGAGTSSSAAATVAAMTIQHQLLSTNAAGIEVTEGSLDSDSEEEDGGAAAAVVSAMYHQQHHHVVLSGGGNNNSNNNNSAVSFAQGTVTGSSGSSGGGATTTTVGGTAVNTATVGPLAFVLEDIRRMEIPIGTLEEFLLRHDPARNGNGTGIGNGNGITGSGSGNTNTGGGGVGNGIGVSTSSGNTTSNTLTVGNNNSNNNPTPSTMSMSGTGQANVISALLGRTGNASCLLTDSHDYSVRHHQLVHLQEEFPEIDFLAFLEQCNKGGYIAYTAITAQYAPLIKQLLMRLVDIERQYAEQVRTSKQKDFLRATEVIVGMANERNEIDETMIRAHTRAEDIQLAVHRIMNQL